MDVRFLKAVFNKKVIAALVVLSIAGLIMFYYGSRNVYQINPWDRVHIMLNIEVDVLPEHENNIIKRPVRVIHYYNLNEIEIEFYDSELNFHTIRIKEEDLKFINHAADSNTMFILEP